MKEISQIMENEIGVGVKSIKFYLSGIINSTYLVNDSYIFRKRKDFNHFDLNQDNEIEIEKNLKGKNITIPYLYVDKNYKVSRFISTACDLSNYGKIDDKAIISVANKIKLLHEIPYRAKSDFLPFIRIDDYYFNAHVKKFIKHDEIVNNLKKYYKDAKLCLCHNDLVPGNILIANNNFYLIDFEYAGNNVSFFDVASFIVSNDLNNQKQIDLLISTYYDNKIPKNIKQMTKDFCSFILLMWYYWSVMMYKETKDEKYHKMAYHHISTLIKYLDINIKPEDFAKDLIN